MAFDAQSPSAQEIERALTELWRGDSGASLTAIAAQSALMTLRYVRAIASSDPALPAPDAPRVARICQGCISSACESWTEDDPDVARLLLGVAQGSKGLKRRERRKRVMERYAISYEILTHKRPTKLSYERRVLRTVAQEMWQRESRFLLSEHESSGYHYRHFDFDYVDLRDAHFACVEYAAHLEVTRTPDGYSEVWITRKLTLEALKDRPRHIAIHDGWASTFAPDAYCAPLPPRGDSPEKEQRPYVLTKAHAGTDDASDTFGVTEQNMPRGARFDLSFSKAYNRGQQNHPGHLWFGYFASDDPPVTARLTAKLPPSVEEVRAQVAAPLHGILWDSLIERVDEEHFLLQITQLPPGVAVLLGWHRNY